MKFSKFLVAALVSAALVGCGGGGGSAGTNVGTSGSTTGTTTGTTGSGGSNTDSRDAITTTPLRTTAPSSLVIQYGGSQSYSISGGTGPYTVVSNDVSVATATVSGSSLTIGGVGRGSASLTVTDINGTALSISISVAVPDLISSAPSSVTIAVGAGYGQTYSFSGGAAPYTIVSSSPSIVTASLSGSSFTVTGLSTGSAQVLLKDKYNTALNLGVSVSSAATLPLFTTAPAGLTLADGATGTYNVGGGSGPYSVQSNAPGVATASLAGTSLTISAVAVGSANIVVTDNTGATVTVPVAVNAGQVTVNPTSATAIVGDTLLVSIRGGRAPYAATVTNTAVADASVSGSILTVQVKQPASGVAIRVEDADGLSTSFSLTSAVAQPQIQLSPLSLSISELSTDADPINLSLYGATGAVSAFSSDTALLNATVVGGSVRITTGSNGNRCLPSGMSSKVVTISAIDSTGALATSNISVMDSISTICP